MKRIELVFVVYNLLIMLLRAKYKVCMNATER